MKTVAEVLRWRAHRHPERVALWFEDRETSYGELDRRSNRVANALISAGLEIGQRVCVLDKNHDAFFEVLFAIAKAGGVYTPVNWRLAPPELAYTLNDAQAPLLFLGDEFADSFRKIRGELEHLHTVVAWGTGDADWIPYERFRDGGAESDPRRDTPADESVWQIYTSGTTGHPKGAEITDQGLFEVNYAGSIALRLSEYGVSLAPLPLYHIGGSGYALALFYMGYKIVLCREAEPGLLLQLIEEQKTTEALFVPALLNFLIQHPRCAETDFSALKTIHYGAAPIPEDLLKQCMNAFGCGFVQAYGMTETSGGCVFLAAEDHVIGSTRLRSCGRPTLSCDLRIVEPSGRDCEPGEVGEIWMRGPGLMKGYWNRPEATAETIQDGWLRSGDAGYRDEDGYLYIHDRFKDMIVSGGENVYPAEIESALYGHPAVADVAVIGVPDERWGETVKAIVVKAAGAELSEQELIDFCRDKLAGYKRPRSVDFISELPRNPSGKILKRELREPYWEGHDRRVH